MKLSNEEKIIWSGRPGRMSISPAKQVSLVLLGLVLIFIAHAPRVVIGSDLSKVIPSEVVDFISSSYEIIMILSFAFLLFPLIIKIVLGTTQYVVTNERIVVSAFRHSSSYWYKDLLHVDIKPQTENLCDIVFFSREYLVDVATSAPSCRFKILFVPQDVAEYVNSRVHSCNPL